MKRLFVFGQLMAVTGCLPALDESLAQSTADAGVDARRDAGPALCVSPNATIEGDEECDDGNLDDWDGCTNGCRLDCEPPGKYLSSVTGTCYFLQSSAANPTEAYARCLAAGNAAHVLTLRTEEEVAEVTAGLLNTLDINKVLIGLRVDSDGETWTSLAPGEPGWSARTVCPGCFSFWDQATSQPKVDGTHRVAVMSRDLVWRWTVQSVVEQVAVVCERELPGRPANLCGQVGEDCDPRTTYVFAPSRLNNTKYRVQFAPVRFEEARSGCTSWGGKLLSLESEKERALVVRYGPFISFWVGLSRAVGTEKWLWEDGKEHSQPWADNNQESDTGAGALVVTASFDTNLLQARNPLLQMSAVCRK